MRGDKQRKIRGKESGSAKEGKEERREEKEEEKSKFWPKEEGRRRKRKKVGISCFILTYMWCTEVYLCLKLVWVIRIEWKIDMVKF